MIADEGIEVLGTMGSGRTPEVNITVRSKFQLLNFVHVWKNYNYVNQEVGLSYY
jgi:hypothetical protein